MWKPDPKYAYLYTPVVYNGKTYYHRKDKLQAKKYFDDVKKYEDSKELPESVETVKKKERENMARFLRTGKF